MSATPNKAPRRLRRAQRGEQVAARTWRIPVEREYIAAGAPGVLIMVVCVLVAGLLMTWTRQDPPDEQVKVGLGEPVTMNRYAKLQVVEVRGGDVAQLESYTDPVRTSGVFLMVDVELGAASSQASPVRCELHHGDDVIIPIRNQTQPVPEAGIWTAYSVVFERPPDQLVGSQLSCIQTEYLITHRTNAVIDLGIDEQLAAQLSDGGTVNVLEESYWGQP